MINISKKQKYEIEFLLRTTFGNRVEIGISAFSTKDGCLKYPVKMFSYEECIAIAALTHKNYDPIFAAALVYHKVVYAAPHFAGREVEAPDGTDQVGQLLAGIYRLADGALWSIHADNDVRWVKPQELSREFVVVATRGHDISDEDPVVRAKHLLSPCDERGKLLEAA